MGTQGGRRRAWRTATRVTVGLLLAAGAAAGPGVARASGPPSAGAVSAAAGQVSQRAGELSKARVALAAADARLADLEVQAEVITERYDKTMVDEQLAMAAYRAAMARLARALAREQASHQRVGALAAQDYETGGVGSMAALLGNSGGPQAFMQGAADEQQITQQGTDVLSQDQATTVVAQVFRAQAKHALLQEQAAARRAAALKRAVEAAVARQVTAVQASKALTRRLEAELGAARAHEYELQQARERYLAEQAARQQALEAERAASGSAPVAPGGGGYASWSSGYSLSQGASAAQGQIAANWALTQLGKPYQWGGAGPYTYDCSGLTMDAWAQAGVHLLHWTGYQWPSGPHIPIDQLRPGDLVFYATDTSDPATIHHVGIYIGNGEMVDAPYTGVDVRIDTIYFPGLIGATRPAG